MTFPVTRRHTIRSQYADTVRTQQVMANKVKIRRTQKLDTRTLGQLEAPGAGNVVYYDTEVKGFGCRVTAAGVRSFILNYRTRGGRERRYTIGRHPDLSVTAARAKARELKGEIKDGHDPQGVIHAERGAPTVGELCDRFLAEYLPKKRPLTQRQYAAIIANIIRPKLGTTKVALVSFDDIDAIHRGATKATPIQANRVLSVLSKMFNQAIKWKYRTDNPTKGVERNTEQPRERYLAMAELGQLADALDKDPDQQGANILRLLLLTGARSNEVRSMRWEDIDLQTGVWTKPGSTTKQKTVHRVPLSTPAHDLLLELSRAREPEAVYVFPGRLGGYRTEIARLWTRIRKVTAIKNARPHDLRHTYASLLVSSGHTLPIIGRLLGHTQPATTARYAHLFDDPLKKATEQVGAMLNGKK